ncbi:hypothetical protein [Paeniglutamicibacter sp. NPDC091659]|uniref:hypothetical protein n=1 Tax=Paeniglutamicibacter sp. NPDC091659 TaxID=3364389 RepID=UPI0037F41D68
MALMLLLLAGCAQSPAAETTAAETTAQIQELESLTVPAGASGKPRGQIAANPKTASDVALTATQTMFTYDSRFDLSPADASRRAAPWLSPVLAKATSTERPGGGGATWNEMASHDGYTSVTVELGEDDSFNDTESSVSRQVIATISYHGKNNWSIPDETQILFLTLTKTSGSWHVSALTNG